MTALAGLAVICFTLVALDLAGKLGDTVDHWIDDRRNR